MLHNTPFYSSFSKVGLLLFNSCTNVYTPAATRTFWIWQSAKQLQLVKQSFPRISLILKPSLSLQIGRAGRDGSEATCHAFLDDSDYRRLRSLAHADGAAEHAVSVLLHAVFQEHLRAKRRGGQAAGPRAIGSFGVVHIAALQLQADMREEIMDTLLGYLEVGPMVLPLCSTQGLPDVYVTVR